TAVTPVRRSPEVRDTCPTRTPATSVMAPCGPTGNCPRARKSRGRGIAPHTVIGRILPASCRPLQGGGRIQEGSSALGHPHTSSWARLATGAWGNATRAELRGRGNEHPDIHTPTQTALAPSLVASAQADGVRGLRDHRHWRSAHSSVGELRPPYGARRNRPAALTR